MVSSLAVFVSVIVFILLLVLLFELTGLLGAPYVPSENNDILIAFKKLYKLSEEDVLVDLGSGDGKVLVVADGFGARAIGVEINPILVLFSKIRYLKNKNISIVCDNMYTFELPKDTTVVYVYGNTFVVNRIYDRLQKEAKRIKQNLFFITNAFDCKNATPIKHIGSYYLYEIKSPGS